MEGTSSIGGLASGIDTSGIVDKLMAIEARRITLLQNRQQAELDKQNAFNVLGTSLSTLRSLSIDMADGDNFLSKASALSSNTTAEAASLVSVAASSSALAGTHTLKVTQLAAAEKIGSGVAIRDSTNSAISSDSTALGLTADSFTIQGKADTAKTVNVSSTDSLRDIRDKINQHNSGTDATGVSASILKVGTSDYRLILTADQEGLTDGQVRLAGAALDAGGNLANLQLGTVSQQSLQAALDANVTIDNIAVSRGTNTISDAIDGYTLKLLKADAATTITISTTVDESTVKAKVQSFVDDYNAVMDFINTQMEFDPDTQTSGVLANESILRTIQSQLSGVILNTVPGLASDRSSIALVGVEPDSKGHLSINAAVFDDLLATDANSIRDVFAASASTNNSALEFIAYGAATVSGTYAVNISTAAAKATVTGTTDLSAGLPAVGGAEQVTITEGSGRQAVVNLTDSQSLASIVSAFNTEFGQTYTEQRQLGTALLTGLAGGTAATSATLLQDLSDGAANLNIAIGDTISISGTNRAGLSANYTFAVSDPATDTVGDLLVAIQVAFDQQLAASLDANGRVVITDNQEGDSSLSFSLVANNEGGGTLAFGSEAVLQEGRYAMTTSAVASGNFLQFQSNSYGSSSSFTIAQSVNNLGIIDQAYAGQDVAGTINGESATGTGQSLLANSGNADGLLLMYTGTSLGAIADVSVNLGVAAQLDGMLDTFTNPVSGLMQLTLDASSDIYDSLQEKIEELTLQLEQERTRLTATFLAMEKAMSQTNVLGSFITQQTNLMSSAG
ncbi:MAG: flagellar filament capping protein FliD [Mariprofundaceae bacterium]